MRYSSVTTRVSSTLTGLAPAPVLPAAALLNAAAAAAAATAVAISVGSTLVSRLLSSLQG
jgi:hypothetical protein